MYIACVARYYARNSSWQDAGAIAEVWADASTLGLNSLRAGQSMVLGEMLVSESKAFSLQLQEDGDLVLRSNDGHLLWRSYTSGLGTRVDMLWDGNLVVLDQFEAIVFQTNTSSHTSAYAILHDVGSLAVYWRSQLLWTSSQ
jgi:hypothetical protein